MKRITTILITLMLIGIPFSVCHAEFGIGLPSIIKQRVEDLDKKVEDKKEEEQGVENHSPNVPSNPAPTDGAKGCPVTQDISWNGGDPDVGDSVVYDVYFGDSISPSLVSADQTGTTYDPGTLNNNTVYYWKIVAKDNYGASVIGEVWSFETVIIRSWKTAELIEEDNTGHAVYPQIAIGQDGNAVAVWSQNDGTNNNIYANRYVSGSGWQTVELIETDNTGAAAYPQIAIGPDGSAIAVWHQQEGTRRNIWANRYVSGSGWQTAELIETNDETTYAPQIAIGPDGNALAVWRQYDGSRYNIWANRYVSGSGWGTAELIETDDTGGAGNPQVAIGPNGNALAVWGQYDGSRDNIWANRYVSGVWQTAEQIELDAGSASDPQVAIGQDNNAIVVWGQDDGTRFSIYANSYVSGSWQGAELIETDNAGDAISPQIAIGQDGNALAVWHQYDGTRENIWANSYVSGSWRGAELIETDNTGFYAIYPQVAIGPDNNAIAVWGQDDGTRENIWANRYVSGVWKTAELIETDDGSATAPQVVIGGDNNAIAVWGQFGVSTLNIWANRYDDQ